MINWVCYACGSRLVLIVMISVPGILDLVCIGTCVVGCADSDCGRCISFSSTVDINMVSLPGGGGIGSCSYNVSGLYL